MSLPNKADRKTTILFCLLLVTAVVVIVAVGLCGCTSTVAPKLAGETQASWDGTNQNSGIIGLTVDHQAIITLHASDRYNGLITIYGARFNPRLVPDAGLTRVGNGGTCIMDAQHLAYFATMQRWARQAKPVWTQ
jgi:hypothetical protein